MAFGLRILVDSMINSDSGTLDLEAAGAMDVLGVAAWTTTSNLGCGVSYGGWESAML
jgi:hypothetical protein